MARSFRTKRSFVLLPPQNIFFGRLCSSFCAHRIVEDVSTGFCRRLSQSDQDLLIAKLERIPGVNDEAAGVACTSVRCAGSERFL
jgi:hypothetical protein